MEPTRGYSTTVHHPSPMLPAASLASEASKHPARSGRGITNNSQPAVIPRPLNHSTGFLQHELKLPVRWSLKRSSAASDGFSGTIPRGDPLEASAGAYRHLTADRQPYFNFCMSRAAKRHHKSLVASDRYRIA
jgi:hypothetical protein